MAILDHVWFILSMASAATKKYPARVRQLDSHGRQTRLPTAYVLCRAALYGIHKIGRHEIPAATCLPTHTLGVVTNWPKKAQVFLHRSHPNGGIVPYFKVQMRSSGIAGIAGFCYLLPFAYRKQVRFTRKYNPKTFFFVLFYLDVGRYLW